MNDEIIEMFQLTFSTINGTNTLVPFPLFVI